MYRPPPPQSLPLPSSLLYPSNRPSSLPKQELPIHLQVLFAPRMPLVYVKPPKRNKCRSFDPLLVNGVDMIDKFEDEEPPVKIFVKSKKEKCEEQRKRREEEEKNRVKEEMLTCKHNFFRTQSQPQSQPPIPTPAPNTIVIVLLFEFINTNNMIYYIIFILFFWPFLSIFKWVCQCTFSFCFLIDVVMNFLVFFLGAFLIFL